MVLGVNSSGLEPGGGVVEVQPACAVEGFFGLPTGRPLGRRFVLVSVAAGQIILQLIGASDADGGTGKVGHLHHAVDEDPA